MSALRDFGIPKEEIQKQVGCAQELLELAEQYILDFKNKQ